MNTEELKLISEFRRCVDQQELGVLRRKIDLIIAEKVTDILRDDPIYKILKLRYATEHGNFFAQSSTLRAIERRKEDLFGRYGISYK